MRAAAAAAAQAAAEAEARKAAAAKAAAEKRAKLDRTKLEDSLRAKLGVFFKEAGKEPKKGSSAWKHALALEQWLQQLTSKASVIEQLFQLYDREGGEKAWRKA